MPDVLVQKCADVGARDSTCAQIERLKARFSGPCSWIIVAEAQADARVEWMWRRPVVRRVVIAEDWEWVELESWLVLWRKFGSVLRRYSWISALVSKTSTIVLSRAKWRAAMDMPIVPRPIRVILWGSLADIVVCLE
jgi:hypothetical protein